LIELAFLAAGPGSQALALRYVNPTQLVARVKEEPNREDRRGPGDRDLPGS
jgi:hypothetical protein